MTTASARQKTNHTAPTIPVMYDADQSGAKDTGTTRWTLTTNKPIIKWFSWAIYKRFFASIGLLFFAMFALSACSSSHRDGYASTYTEAVNNPAGDATYLQVDNLTDNSLMSLTQPFINVFTNIKQGDLAASLANVYASEVYFNDTFHTIYKRDELIRYLQPVADKMQYSKVEINDISTSGNSVYLRWKMDIGFSVAGKQIDSSSIGMSQLLFDQNGKVVLHQDFWDNTEGFFRHLPVLGSLITKTRSQL